MMIGSFSTGPRLFHENYTGEDRKSAFEWKDTLAKDLEDLVLACSS